MFSSFGFHFTVPITKEEAEKNAKELLDQEEQEKAKTNKKRMKKKKQRERKRQQKLEESRRNIGSSTDDLWSNHSDCSATSNAGSIDLESINGELSDSDTEDNLDLESKFVQHVQTKIKNKTPSDMSERTNERGQERRPTKPHDAVTVETAASFQDNSSRETCDVVRIKKSMDLAKIGSILAQNERFSDAIECYTDAIKLNPEEFRFLGNRSYIYERYGKYAEALKDAEDAIFLQPDFINGQFRRAKALKGLQKYSEAIEVFQKIWASDVRYTEAAAEIAQCKVKLQDPTRSMNVKSNPILGPCSPTGFMGGTGTELVTGHLIHTRANGSIPTPITNASVRRNAPVTMSRVHPVWVGNITDTITEEVLRSKFEHFGPIYSMRILYDRKCAFINFTAKTGAERAVRELQGLNINGTTFVLQLRPEQPNINISIA